VTEQKEQKNPPDIKKRPRLASRIARMVWITVLSTLLAASLFLQAPWKVTTLVLIFLFAATILPCAYRKWFRAVVGCAAAAVVIWVFLPADSDGWQPYTFDEELAALEAKHTIPDSENAAVIYNQLLEDYNEEGLSPYIAINRFGDYIGKKPWLSKDYPELSQWLQQQEGAIEKLIEASRIKQCRFPISADTACFDEIMHRLRPMQRWVLLLSWAANNDIAEGRTEKGLQKYIAMLQIGKHLNQQPSLLGFMVGTGVELNVTSQLKRFVVTGDATEEHLALIEKSLAEIKRDWSYDLPRILDYEKLVMKNFWGLFYEVNPEGKIRFTRSLASIIRKQFLRDEEELTETYWRRRFMKASVILDWFSMPSTPQDAGAIIDSAYERYYAMANPDFDWQKGPREFSLNLIKFNYRYTIEVQLCVIEPTYYSIHDTYLRTIAQQRGGRIIVALRRYKNKNGNWPASSDEVKSSAPEEIFIDPINGGSFVYKLTGDNFKLYSKGKNGIDDGGRRDYWYEKTGADDLMIWSSEDN